MDTAREGQGFRGYRREERFSHLFLRGGQRLILGGNLLGQLRGTAGKVTGGPALLGEQRVGGPRPLGQTGIADGGAIALVAALGEQAVQLGAGGVGGVDGLGVMLFHPLPVGFFVRGFVSVCLVLESLNEERKTLAEGIQRGQFETVYSVGAMIRT